MAPRIEDYDYDQPSIDDLLESLGQVLPAREVQAALAIARGDVGLGRGEDLSTLSLAALIELGEALTRQRGLASVIGRSFVIRASAFRELASRVG